MSTKAHAERLAHQIEKYWRARGFAHVTARAVQEAEALPGRDGSPTEWTVRVSPPLKNGVPAGATDATARSILRAFDRRSEDWRKFDDDHA